MVTELKVKISLWIFEHIRKLEIVPELLNVINRVIKVIIYNFALYEKLKR